MVIKKEQENQEVPEVPEVQEVQEDDEVIKRIRDKIQKVIVKKPRTAAQDAHIKNLAEKRKGLKTTYKSIPEPVVVKVKKVIVKEEVVSESDWI